jgi:hypothetical protein
MRRRFKELTRFTAMTAAIALGGGALVWAAECLGVTLTSLGAANGTAGTFDAHATVPGGSCLGGFDAGDLFAGNGQPGQIVRLSAAGEAASSPWVTLPVESAIDRDNIHQDASCSFDGDLIVAASNGPASTVWRITAAGVPTQIASLDAHIDFVITLPGDAVRFGPVAGRAVAGDGTTGTLFAIDAGGTVVTVGAAAGGYQNYATARAIRPASLDLVPGAEPDVAGDGDFLAVDTATNRLLTAPNAQFECHCGNLLMTEPASGLSVLSWNGTAFDVVPVPTTVQAADPASVEPAVTAWGAVRFANGIACHPCVGVIGNYLWKDLNADGIRDEDEPAMAGVTLTLTRDGAASFSQTVKSDATGHYQFGGLCAGTYLVTVNTPGTLTTALAGSDQAVDSNPNGVSVTLATDGDSNLTIGFGFKTAS